MFYIINTLPDRSLRRTIITSLPSKMKPGESLNPEPALIYNCNDNVATATFISGLQVTHSYKHLVKMRDILTRAQRYIQIEDAI